MKNWGQLFAFLQINKKKTNNAIENGQRMWTDTSQEIPNGF